MKKTKKILAIVLSVIMIISIFPSAVLATEADVTGMTAEYAAEAVDASSEEQEVESTVEDVSEEEMEASSEQGAETTDEETVEPATETDEVPVQGMETADEEKVEGPITLTENGDDYTVTAIFDASSGLPAGVQMKVSEIKESGENAKQYEDLYDQTLEAVQKDTKTEVELTYARFFDISFHTESGEVEPSGPVSVNIKYDEAIDVESSDAVSVYHFDEQKEEIRSMDIETAGSGESVDEISFETDGFSIYAVVGTTDAVAESRMTLNFYKRNSTDNSEGTDDDKLIATVYVKNGDDTDAVLEQIIYDPGVGTLASGQLFKGWIEKENYTTADVNEKMNVADIRAWAKKKANENTIIENEEHNFYAMIFNTFSVTYKDEDGVTIRSDALITDGDKVDYTIDQIYEPADQDEMFLGWYATPEGNVTPKDSSAAYPYENETEVTINGNVVFSVYAPKGYWLNFEGNGKGAKYTPPQFIIKNSTDANGVTVKPEDPIRNGYTFDGWYTGAPAAEGEDPTGENFVFGSSLEENTTLYAKWKTADSVSYSVIIWKQRATDDQNAEEAQKKYDVADVITLKGKPGESASNVVKQEGASVNTGRGNSVNNYKINGEEKNYVGFHAGRYDTDVTIDPEGTTVLNVYYDRNLITISFDAGTYTTGFIFPQTHTRYIYDSSTKKYVNKVTYTGLYDSELSFDWPTQYWESSSGSGSASPMLWYYGNTVLTFLGAFKLPEPSNVSINLAYNDPGSTPIRFIRQKPDGTWPNLSDTDYVLIVYSGNGTFTITNKYPGFTAYQYKKGDYTTSDSGWNTAIAEETQVSDYNALNIRFKRETFKIRYLDGTYFNGDGAIKEEASGVQLHESDPIYYQASIATYNKDGGDYYNPGNKDEYVFAGWYADPTCITEYKFETMPGNDIAVYAKWVQKQYRVFLHPNVPSDDASFSMGNQKTSFRVDYYEKIANGYPIKAARDNYDLIGWYTDAACKNAFNFAAYRLTDETVKTPYDTSDDKIYNPTDETERDQYGNVESGQEGVNKDAENNRIWILSKLELYAKWRSTLDGAKGIDIIYDAGEGTNPPTDILQYLDNCEANAGAASTPPDTTKQFKYWVIQKWDGNEYVNTGETVYPGDVFTVLKSNAKAIVTEWVNPNDDADVRTVEDPTPGTTPPDSTHTKIKKATYTVSLKAEYGDKDAPTPTHITWYANNGTGDTISNTGLQINKAVDIVKPGNKITYNGYKFLGWARMTEVSDAQGKVTSIGGTAPENLALDLSEEDLFLKWDAENGKFLATASTGSGYTAGQEVTQIAADEKIDYHGMVAVWSAQYGVYHSSSGVIDWYDMPEPTSTVDFTGLVAKDKDYLYGGYYKYVETSETHKGDAYTVSGKSVTPTKATVYYLKEVDWNYLKPNVYLVYNENHNGLIQDLYGFVNIDDVNDYTDCGVIVDGGDPRSVKNTLVSKSIVITKDGETEPYATLTPGNLFSQENAFFGYTSLKDKISGSATVQIKGYYVTKDNIKVTGYKDRMIKFAAEDPTYKAPVFKGWTTSPGGNTKCGLKSVTPTLEEWTGSNSAGKLAARRTLTLTAPADQIEYRITKVYDTGSEEQTVQEGNHTGEISYTPKDGYLFVGWYKDQAFTEPADFSNVQSDLTVYARFVSKKNISLTMTRKSQKSGKTTFNTVAAVKDKAALGLEMVTVSTDTAKATLSTRTVKKSGSGKKVSYTTRYKGKISIKGLSEIDSFTVSVSWTTPDGTTVTGPVWTCTYNQGNVAIR